MELSMDKRENILWITNIILLFFVLLDSKVLPVVILWNINVLLMGNIKRIGANSTNFFIIFIRRILFFAVFVPILVIEPNIIWIKQNYYYLLPLGVIIGVIMLLPKIKQLGIFLSFDFISISNKLTLTDHITYGVINFLTPLGEELFYRLMIIRTFKDYFGISSIIISTVMFILHHATCKWSEEFSKYDFVMQMFFGLVVGTMFYYTDQLLPCVLAHITYNMPNIILNVKKFLYFYCNIGNEYEEDDIE